MNGDGGDGKGEGGWREMEVIREDEGRWTEMEEMGVDEGRWTEMDGGGHMDEEEEGRRKQRGEGDGACLYTR